MSSPRWYKALDPKDQEAVDQAAHVLMGFGAGLTFGLLLLWRREWVKQWPPGKPFMAIDPSRQFKPTRVTQLDRVADTKRDLLFMDIGYTAGQVTQAAGLVLWAVL